MPISEAEIRAEYPDGFEKGLALYNADRVQLDKTSGGLAYGGRRYFVEDGKTCLVTVKPAGWDGPEKYRCNSCGNSRPCPHIPAVKLYELYERENFYRPVHDVKEIIGDFLPDLGERDGESGALYCLQPIVCREDEESRDRFFSLGLKIGETNGNKMYSVRSMDMMTKLFSQKGAFTYGKSMTLTHDKELFDEKSRRLITLVTDFVRQYNMLTERFKYRLDVTTGVKNRLPLAGNIADALYDMYADEGIEYAPTKKKLTLREGIPQGEMTVLRRGKVGLIRIGNAADILYTEGEKYGYVCDGTTLLRVPKERYSPFTAILNRFGGEYRIPESELSVFASAVLPDIGDCFKVNDPEGILSAYEADACTPCFRFALIRDALCCQLSFRYGEEDLLYTNERRQDGIRHDLRAEMLAYSRVKKYFPQSVYRNSQPVENTRALTGEENIFDFLAQDLPKFEEWGEVFLSDELIKKEMRVSRPAVGISVSNGMLTMNLEMGDFPPEELEALYESLLRKRKYHKLKDGRYLPLNGSGLEALAEAAHMTQLTPDELKRGHIEMPAFRAMYLDSVLGGREELRFTRDARYRALVRSFKTVGDSDYQVPEDLNGVLRPYQETGFKWLKTLESAGFGGILADEMGLGKTIQVIAYLLTVRRQDCGLPSLIVCPASLILNWADEIRRFAPGMKCAAVLGALPARKEQITDALRGDTDVIVTSYEQLRRDIALYAGEPFHTCVLDEGQFVKNQSTKVSDTVKRINAAHRFVLTGTPVENRLSELWNLFDFLMPGYLFNYHRFSEKLEKPIIRAGDETARAQLACLIRPFMLRRLKKDVLTELPPKIEHVRRIALSEEEQKIYAAYALAARRQLTGQADKIAVLAALTRLRQICCDAGLCVEDYAGETSKLDACMELVRSMAENGHQILLFSQFTGMLEILEQRLREAGVSAFMLQGSTPKEKRAQLVRDFNAGGAQVFLISLKAGGTGLNLTAADVVIHYDPWWNSAAANQATDRAHRIGQRSSVHVYKLIAQDSIEEKIMEMQKVKAELLDDLTDVNGILSLSRDELMKLLE